MAAAGPPPIAAGTAAAMVTRPQVVPASVLNSLRSRIEDTFTFFDTPKNEVALAETASRLTISNSSLEKFRLTSA